MHPSSDPIPVITPRWLSASGAAPLCLGCSAIGHIGDDEAAEMVRLALDRGVGIFDTADVYANGGSEEALGRMLPRERSGLFVITKFGHPSAAASGSAPCGASTVRISIDASLERLRTERLDCALIHFPDPQTPYAETLASLDQLMRAGKLASYGVSNFSPEQLAALIRTAGEMGVPGPQLVQEEYSLVRRRRAEALLPLVLEKQLGLMPFFPLASGLLTGKYLDGGPISPLRRRIVRSFDDRFLDAPTREQIVRLDALCSRWGIAMAAASLAWLASRDGVCAVTVGATSATQLAANLEAIGTALPHAFVTALDEILADSDPAVRPGAPMSNLATFKREVVPLPITDETSGKVWPSVQAEHSR